MTSEIWVVSRDYNYEGLAAPSAGFLTKEEADAYAEHVGRLDTYVVHEVKLMRFLPAKIEPAVLEPILSDPPRSTETT